MPKTTIELECRVCGQPFRTPPCYADRRKTCSNACRAEWARMTRGQSGGATVTAPCACCGTQITRRYSPSKGRPKLVFCSRDCHSRYARAEGTVILECDRCGKAFERAQSAARQRSRRAVYCSHACRDAKVERTCEVCGASFSVSHYQLADRSCRFCSKACQRVGMATPTHTCAQCGKEFTRAGRPTSARFCTHECYAQWLADSGVMAGENSPNWQGGISWSNRLRGENWARQRKKALKRDEHRCARCKKPRTAVRRLIVHHMIPFRAFDGDYEAANQLGNLVTLCDACHTTTEWEVTRGERLF